MWQQPVLQLKNQRMYVLPAIHCNTQESEKKRKRSEKLHATNGIAVMKGGVQEKGVFVRRIQRKKSTFTRFHLDYPMLHGLIIMVVNLVIYCLNCSFTLKIWEI